MANLTPDTPTRSGGITTSSSFYAGWYAHTPGEDVIPVYALGVTDHTPGDGLTTTRTTNVRAAPGYGFDNTLLGVLYVSKTTQLTPGTVLYSD